MPTPTFHIRHIPIYGDLILAPMDGYSDYPFRALCRALGSAMSYTEFVNAADVLQRPAYVAPKLYFTENERPVTFQLYGDNPQQILEAALRVRERNPDIIDVNMGCPAKTVSQRGAGVGLMRTPEKIAQIFNLLTHHLDLPITGKMRLGWDDANRNYLQIARIVEENGGAALAVHGRTKQQGYTGFADWEAIEEVARTLRIPVLGNGDVTDPAKARVSKQSSNCAAFMVGRAAMSNPWIFSGLRREQVSPEQVQTTLEHHLALNLAFYGTPRGLILFRKFAVRYLAPYPLPRDLRQTLLTRETPQEFLTLAAQILAAPPPPVTEPQEPEIFSCEVS
ncbi:MAG: tRNA dihydrouridine synthase DusB [Anaerolineales bacterium]